MTPLHERDAEEGGFTLIELVVSLVLLTIGVFSVIQVFYSGLRLSVTSDYLMIPHVARH